MSILATIQAAREAEVAILCLPELCVSGYGCEDAFFSEGVQQTALELLTELVPFTNGLVVTLGLPLKVDGQLYIAMAVLCDGKLMGFSAKQHLAGDGIHYEPRWFHPWPANHVSSVKLGGNPYPVGDLLYDCGGIKIGIEVCRDAWGRDRPGARLARRGADIILNPSASHFAFAKQEIRRAFSIQASQDYHVSFAYSNLLGNEAGRAIFDGGALIASRGEIVAIGPRLSFGDYALATADIDIAATRADRQQAQIEIVPEKVVASEFSIPSVKEARQATQALAWDHSPASKEEEFARAVPLALFDYLRKSRAGGFVVSLSGGADSSAVATMIWLMVRMAIEEIGKEAFVEKLNHIPGISNDQDESSLVQTLLTCVYQATINSSETTRNSAQTVSAAVGARFLELNIDSLVEEYVSTVSQAIDRNLTWETDDLALQNIQARARGPGAWLLANVQRALLLATSNRSEAAVGYATMDGDTCGGLSPIAGIDKAFLLHWLKWMESEGPQGIGPLPALHVVNSQEPTAELRPSAENQTDESDLMPYSVLDAIERYAIRDKLMPVEVWQEVRGSFNQYDAQQLGRWVERFFQLWCRNQWKRERYAPSFHLDDENLDPKTWCRFPILSGGFERELNTLREELERITA